MKRKKSSKNINFFNKYNYQKKIALTLERDTNNLVFLQYLKRP